MKDSDIESVRRFVALARQGARKGASSGEIVANKLAVALQAIGDDMAVLDLDAIQGFAKLCELASGPWPTEELKETVFYHVNLAAGRRRN